MVELNTELVTRTILRHLAGVPELGTERVLLENPDTAARFPCVVVSELLCRQRYGGACYDLSIKAEVWAKQFYEAMHLSDLVRIRLRELNFHPANPTPQLPDEITKTTRCGGYYECRWNAITNTFESNR